MTLERRGFLKGLSLLVAAPALVKFDSLMPVKLWMPPKVWTPQGRYIIKSANVFFDKGGAYSWHAYPGEEIVVLPGQKAEVRFDQTIRVDLPGQERQSLSLTFEVDGKTYVQTDDHPAYPLFVGDIDATG